MFPALYRSSLYLFTLATCIVHAQNLEVVRVRSEAVQRTILLPGELLPYQRVSIHARANGYVERIPVDRGSTVKQGQVLASLIAPELAAQSAEAESKMETAEAVRAEAEARLAGVRSTYDRLKTASATEGAIAGNELVQAEKMVDAALAAVRSSESAVRSLQSALRATKQFEAYLRVTAPFSGVITERFVHPGALVGPGSGSAGALLELEQISRLRLVAAIPEAEVTSVRRGTRVEFRVPAFPGRTFTGTVARIDRSLDAKSRSMQVELDVANSRNELSPGMYPEVSWPARGAGQSLLVPPTAIVTTTERTFVIRVREGRAEWVNVRKAGVAGEMMQVLGPLSPGDSVVRRGSDEIREGSKLSIQSDRKHSGND